MAWAPEYATDAQLRIYLRTVDAGDDTDEIDYTLSIAAASRAIDKACGRQFGSTTIAYRYYTPRWSEELSKYVADVDDFMSVSGMAVAVDTAADQTFATAVTDFLKYPLNAAANGLPWTMLAFGSSATVLTTPGSLRVYTPWGWTATPDAIVTATMMQATRYAKRRDAPLGIAGSPEMGSELRLLARLDPDVEQIVNIYRRYW